jgi:hypothetical protein
MIQEDSKQFALVRLLTSDVDKSIDLLTNGEYVYDLTPVMAIELDNKPGTLAETAEKIGTAGVNISYVYGSVSPSDGKTLFVFCPEDIDLAVQTFQK